MEDLGELSRSALLQVLRTFDGKAVSVLWETGARFDGSVDCPGQLSALIEAREGSVSDDATWLIQNYAKSIVVPEPPEIATIVVWL